MSSGVEMTRDEGVVVVRFTRPEVRNPLSREVVAGLYAIFDEIVNNSRAQKLIFTGTGDMFASGADLREIADVTADEAPEFARFGQELMHKIVRLPQTTIAAINGVCFGGALDLALACDIRIGSLAARFAHPGTGLGIITGWGGTQRLPRLVGTANALEMFFTASPIDAHRALQIGLVDEVVDDPLSRALAFVSRGAVR